VQDGVPTADVFESAIRAIGATSLDQVVIYDRDNPLAALVLWRLFRAFGHRDACVLEGGIAAWRGASGDLASAYSQHEPGTWRAQRGAADTDLAADIQRLRQSAR
jgi:thiosulfate/3-mercaptopyruvate sulfurtransferase